MRTKNELKIRAMKLYPDSSHLQAEWVKAHESYLPNARLPAISSMYVVAMQETSRSWREVEDKWGGRLRK